MKQFYTLLLIIFTLTANAQNIEDILDQQLTDNQEPVYTDAVFKSVQLINAHTTKIPGKGELVFLISHRFGPLSSGFSDLWGLDLATIRLGLEYGLSETTSIGIGRSTYKSNWDFFAKQLLLRQSDGNKSIPLTLGLLASMNISSDKWPDDGRKYLFAHRMNYSFQILASRKFNQSISLQLMPTYIHYNLVKTPDDSNDLFALGAGGRFKITKWMALTGEYHYLFNKNDSGIHNPLSFGAEIETGGHVFQLFFTNATGIFESAYIAETTGSWLKGDIRFGFNISRTF
ncbi:MAG: hypothetical protein KA807_07310 [Prolixibacteraceae bacterium]|nr:hypothetical protein [Prolixibacteraceae bacterium]